MNECLPPGTAEACQILLGVEPSRAAAVLAELEPGALKAAFRRHALRVHPDRAATLQVDRQELERRFKMLRQAFDLLSRYLATRDELARARVRRREVDDYWHGAIPRQPLRLGEYLYFSRWLPWRMVANALVAQRHRPRWGAVAVTLGLMTQAEVEQLEMRRLKNERLGDAAVRLGKLSPADCELVMLEQRRHTPPLGELLLRAGALERHEVAHVLEHLHMHNASWADPFARRAA